TDRCEDIDDAHAGGEAGCDALARHRRWHRSRFGSDTREKYSYSIDRLCQRIDDPAFPGCVWRRRSLGAQKHGIADAGVGIALIGRDENVFRSDAHDLARASARRRTVLDDVAEPGRAR